GPTDRRSFQIEARRRTELSGKPAQGKLPTATTEGSPGGPTDGAEAAPGAPALAGVAGFAPATAATQASASAQPSSTVQAAGRAAAARPAPASPNAQAAQAAPGPPGATAQAGAPTSPSDALGELLTQREEALERESSILRQLRAHLAPGRREVSLNLNPAELGRMQLRLAVRGGRLTAHLKAESHEALAAIERQLPELSASLEAQGFEVQAFDLELADTGLAGEGFGDPRPGTQAAPAVPGLLADALGDAARPATKTPSTSAADGGLDLLV
ncbi:MAG: flagellar hook-length control protein FliK, partial [Planctomycetota bacterium]|nr:flagellar hook-length control protein FliK [Planctomycetota bacterium]